MLVPTIYLVIAAFTAITMLLITDDVADFVLSIPFQKDLLAGATAFAFVWFAFILDTGWRDARGQGLSPISWYPAISNLDPDTPIFGDMILRPKADIIAANSNNPFASQHSPGTFPPFCTLADKPAAVADIISAFDDVPAKAMDICEPVNPLLLVQNAVCVDGAFELVFESPAVIDTIVNTIDICQPSNAFLEQSCVCVDGASELVYGVIDTIVKAMDICEVSDVLLEHNGVCVNGELERIYERTATIDTIIQTSLPICEISNRLLEQNGAFELFYEPDIALSTVKINHDICERPNMLLAGPDVCIKGALELVSEPAIRNDDRTPCVKESRSLWSFAPAIGYLVIFLLIGYILSLRGDIDDVFKFANTFEALIAYHPSFRHFANPSTALSAPPIINNFASTNELKSIAELAHVLVVEEPDLTIADPNPIQHSVSANPPAPLPSTLSITTFVSGCELEPTAAEPVIVAEEPDTTPTITNSTTSSEPELTIELTPVIIVEDTSVAIEHSVSAKPPVPLPTPTPTSTPPTSGCELTELVAVIIVEAPDTTAAPPDTAKVASNIDATIIVEEAESTVELTPTAIAKEPELTMTAPGTTEVLVLVQISVSDPVINEEVKVKTVVPVIQEALAVVDESEIDLQANVTNIAKDLIPAAASEATIPEESEVTPDATSVEEPCAEFIAINAPTEPALLEPATASIDVVFEVASKTQIAVPERAVEPLSVEVEIIAGPVPPSVVEPELAEVALEVVSEVSVPDSDSEVVVVKEVVAKQEDALEVVPVTPSVLAPIVPACLSVVPQPRPTPTTPGNPAEVPILVQVSVAVPDATIDEEVKINPVVPVTLEALPVVGESKIDLTTDLHNNKADSIPAAALEAAIPEQMEIKTDVTFVKAPTESALERVVALAEVVLEVPIQDTVPELIGKALSDETEIVADSVPQSKCEVASIEGVQDVTVKSEVARVVPEVIPEVSAADSEVAVAKEVVAKREDALELDLVSSPSVLAPIISVPVKHPISPVNILRFNTTRPARTRCFSASCKLQVESTDMKQLRRINAAASVVAVTPDRTSPMVCIRLTPALQASLMLANHKLDCEIMQPVSRLADILGLVNYEQDRHSLINWVERRYQLSILPPAPTRTCSMSSIAPELNRIVLDGMTRSSSAKELSITAPPVSAPLPQEPKAAKKLRPTKRQRAAMILKCLSQPFPFLGIAHIKDLIGDDKEWKQMGKHKAKPEHQGCPSSLSA